ncbi:ribonuclease P protein component [Chloroflexota bacterium]
MRGERYLKKPAHYALVYNRGSSWASKLLVMKTMPNELNISRYGLSVSKRVGKAVVRNRVKRLLREILRLTPLKTGWDMIFVVRHLSAYASYADLEKTVKELLLRAHLTVGENEDYCPRND